MKRCPECRRNYYDETLLYCLDDGTALLEGPSADDPPTVAFSNSPSESLTRLYEPRERWTLASFSKRYSIIAGVLGIALLLTFGIASYLYYERSGPREIESIAVMPFVNESGNADLDYLSDGMTEALINSLTQLPDLNVKPRSSTFRYRGRESDAKTIGGELNVRRILNGRLIQRTDEITLFLTLIDAATENQIWGKQYTRKLGNLVTLQTEIVRDVSEGLKSKLTGADEQRLAKNKTENPEAYRLYLQGRFFWNKRTPKDIGRAIGYFQQAIGIDSNYALAYAGLADALAQPSDVIPYSEREKKSKDAALKALALDDDLAEAHAALGHILPRYDLDFKSGERELKRAFDLDPNWIDTYQRFGELYSFLGRHDEALAWIKKGLELEPFSIPLHSAYGATLFRDRRYDEAIIQLRKTLEMDPNARQPHVTLWGVYWMKGMHAESVAERSRHLEIGGEGSEAARLQEAFLTGGWEAYLHAERVRFTGDRTIERNAYWTEAIVLIGLGENEKAFAALNSSIEARENPALVFLKVEPRLDPLRGDPRFAAMLKKLGFPE